MQTQWFDLMLVIAGGIVGIAGGLLTAIVSNRFAIKKAWRDNLLVAYTDWFRAIYHALDEAQRLWLYDAIEKMKEDEHPVELDDIPSSPSGKTREEHVTSFAIALDGLRAAEARVLLVERRPYLRSSIRDLSNLQVPIHKQDENAGRRSVAIIAYIRGKEEGINKILDTVAYQNPDF
jgi:hypothetical protein